jgi:hypothetical protein
LHDHQKIITWYLFAALIARTLVKIGSFVAIGLLLWDGVPGTRFDGIPRGVSIPSLALFGLVSAPIFVIGIYQDMEKVKRWGDRRAQRTAVLDDVDLR